MEVIDWEEAMASLSSIRERFKAEPFLWAFAYMATRFIHKMKSKLLSILFNAPNLYLGPKCVVRGAKFIIFGNGAYANSHLWLEAVTRYGDQRFSPSIQIGDSVRFSDSVHITCIASIVIKSGVLFGSKVHVTDHNHGIYRGPIQSNPDEPPSERPLGGGGPVVIGKNVWVGDNVVIIGPVVIGDGAIVASNSIVKQDILPRTIVGGIPAKPIKRYDETQRAWIRI